MNSGGSFFMTSNLGALTTEPWHLPQCSVYSAAPSGPAATTAQAGPLISMTQAAAASRIPLRYMSSSLFFITLF